jgi:hypothetical protein
MKILSDGQTWNQALRALRAGKYVNHAVWGANQPTKAPDFVGPTALALVSKPGEKKDVFVVVTDTGVVIHDWNPSPDEFQSKEWQIVEIAASVLSFGGAAAVPFLPVINHDPSDPKSPKPVSGPQARPPSDRRRPAT